MRYIAVLLFLTFSLLLIAEKKPPYEYYRLGNQADITSTTQSGIVLMGAGIDVDAAFQWMCELSGNGDFLVIRATGTDAYNPYIQQLCPNSNSVATLIIPTIEAANDEFVINTINQAEQYGLQAAINPITSIIGRERSCRELLMSAYCKVFQLAERVQDWMFLPSLSIPHFLAKA